jgi:23S rRNA (uracil1939-C5)-methyltransferase
LDNTGTFTIHIAKPIYGGMGLGYHDGKVVMVPGVLPGEAVRVSPVRIEKDYMVCTLREILSPSEQRIIPECPGFGSCGGCDYLNTVGPYELQLKKEIALDSLRRTARLSPEQLPEIELTESDRTHYRSHADLKTVDGTPGFYRRETNTCVPFGTGGCLLLAEEIIEGLRRITIPAPGCRVAMDHGKGIHLEGDGTTVREYENGLHFDRDIDSFFQVNRYLRGVMQRAMFDFAEMSVGDSFLEIGCGVGFFSLYFGKQSLHGTGYDINERSIAWARKNAALNGIDSVKFETRPAETIVAGGNETSVMLLDPPRSGLSKKARERVMAVSPKRIVYASCDPATFSRDVASFTGSGYSLTRLMLIDMFPATRHMELMGQMKR